jgi:CheY-like chemotaxis protein
MKSAPGDNATAGSPILVVDDEPVVRQIVKVALERAGRSVVLAQSAEEAIEAVRRASESIAIVLLDWKALAADGGELLTRLRELRPDLKAIVSGEYTQPEAEARLRTANVNAYLQKPYRMSELVALLETVSVGSDSFNKLM